MNSPIRLTFALVILACLLPGTSTSAFGQSISWQTDIEQASKSAEAQGKVVLLHFSADWCRPCKALETFVFANVRVQKAFRDNVVAVKVDVDKFPELAREYGVSGVPFDVAITPKGRVVSKRSSPRDSSTYARMVESLTKTIGELQNGNPALAQQMGEFKDAMKTNKKIAQHNSFVPEKPNHRVPTPSNQSMELKRRSMIANPYAVAASNAAKAAPKVTQNNFFPSQTPAQQAAIQPPATTSPSSPASLTGFAPNMTPPAKQINMTLTKPETTSNDFMADLQNESQQFEPESFSQPALNASNQLDMNAPQNVPSASQEFVANGGPQPQSVQRQRSVDSVSPSSYQPSIAQPVVAGRVEITRPEKLKTLDATETTKGSQRPQVTSQMVEQLFENADSKKVNRPMQALANAKLLIPNLGKSIAPKARPQTQPQAQPTSYPSAKLETRKLPTNVALKGKCPISLLTQGAWVDGDLQWGCLHRERVYLFASEANLKKFQSAPDAFSPLLAGFDPVVFKQSGKLVDGAEEHGVFMGEAPNQRVVLFSSAATRAEFQTSPRLYIETIRQAMKSTDASSSTLLRR